MEENSQFSQLNKVTPLSKYLAMFLFIAMPFIGVFIGYTYAPEKIVGVEKTVFEKVESVDFDNNTPTDQTRNLTTNQVMWASNALIYDTREIEITPYLPISNGTITALDAPAGWTLAFSEQTQGERDQQSKSVLLRDPDMPGKPDTDSTGAYMRLSFLRVENCESSFEYTADPSYLIFSPERSSDNLKIYVSDWVTSRSMGSVPTKTVCIENTTEFHDVVMLELNPLSEENKRLLDATVDSIRLQTN